MKYITLTFLLISISSVSLSGQQWASVIDSDDTFSEAVEKIHDYYRDHEKRGLDYKHFRRWEEFARKRLGPDGEVVNISAVNYQSSIRLERELGGERSTHGNWEEIGPFDYLANDSWSSGGLGRINCTVFHPTNNNIIWVGTAGGGMWKTTNAGTSWTPMTDAFASISITDIFVNPSNTNIIYILTGDSEASPPVPGLTGAGFPGISSIGVLKSTDGGNTWSETGLSFNVTQNKYAYKLIGHPTNPNILLVAMKADGIYRTNNGGDTWTQVLCCKTVWDIEFTPGLPEAVVATSNDGLLRSISGGITWELDNDPSFPTSFDRAEVAMSPSEQANVYVVFGGGPQVNGQFGGVYKSEDFGSSFTMMSNTPNILGGSTDGGSSDDQAWYDLSIIVDPANDSRVFVGGVNLWKSENEGTTWQRETWSTRNFTPNDPYVHADWHALYYRGTRLYANVDGGIYYTDDSGNSWTEITSGLSIMQFYELDILNNEYIGGTQDNGTNGGNIAGSTCNQLWGGDGFGAEWHTGDNSIQYISTQNAIYRRQFGTSIPISPIELGNGDYWFTEVEMHRTDPDYVFVTSNPGGSMEHELFRGNGDAFSFSWDDLGISDLANCQINNFVQSVSSPNTMYVASCNLVFKTVDLNMASPTWLPLNLPFYSSGNPEDVEVDPGNANEIWVAVSGYFAGDKVWFSSNGGSNWQNVSGSLPNVVMNCLVFEPGSNNGIYVGTDIGVFYRNANMSDWIYFSNFLPNVMVTDMEISGGYLYAATYGRGVWRSPLYSACPTTLVLTPANDDSNPFSPGTQFYHASTNIQSTRVIKGGVGTEIYYRAGNRMDMLPGFEARVNNFWEAKVEGCP